MSIVLLQMPIWSNNYYEQCIHDLEEEVNSHSSDFTAVVIVGDFNAHLGTLAGPRGSTKGGF